MKNYKSILLIATSIIITNNNHVVQTGNSISSPQRKYTDYLNQLRHDLRDIPPKDIDAIVYIARQKLDAENPKNDSLINKIMRKAIVIQAKTNTAIMAKRYTNNPEEIEASIRSMVGNVTARLKRGENLNGLALKQFFDQDSLKRLVQQNIKDPHYNSSPIYVTPSPTWSTIPENPIPAPKRPSRLHSYRCSYDEYLAQIKNELRGIPEADINAITAIAKQELIFKKPTNDHKKNNIMREAIVNRVRMNTRTIASKLTNNQAAINNTIQSMSGNVKARLARGNNLNGQALAQFFGPSLEHMVRQSISNTQKKQEPKYRPPIPPKPTSRHVPSAPKQPECCVCFDESFGLKNIPCCNGDQHSDQICSLCLSQITHCPLCRSELRR